MTNPRAKIMVFDEAIKHYDEQVSETEPFISSCEYCGKEKELKYKVYNHAFVFPHFICSHCASVHYAGVKMHTGTIIPVDPLLRYLDEIDPIER